MPHQSSMHPMLGEAARALCGTPRNQVGKCTSPAMRSTRVRAEVVGGGELSTAHVARVDADLLWCPC
eukprot:10751325-Alexandrium_andersonii.AAC.1